MNFRENKQRWSLRKTSLGLISALLGVVYLNLNNTTIVNADNISLNTDTQTSISSRDSLNGTENTIDKNADTVNEKKSVKVSEEKPSTTNLEENNSQVTKSDSDNIKDEENKSKNTIDIRIQEKNVSKENDSLLSKQKQYSVNLNQKKLDHSNSETLNKPSNWHYNQDNNEWTYTKADGKEAENEWVSIDGKQYYFDDNGVMAANGWQTDNNDNFYYFDANGHYLTNYWDHDLSDNTWSYAKSDGKQARDEWINNGQYYMDDTGVMATNGWHTDKNDNSYYFDNNGHYLTNHWDHNTSDNTWSYAKDDGKQAENEWVSINGKQYYFNENGVMAANGWHDDNNDNTYYFDTNGHYLTNYWDYNLSTDEYRYAKADGKQAKNEWVDGQYYIDEDGVMVANKWYTDNNDNNYCFDTNGHYLTNHWDYNPATNEWKYAKSDGKQAQD